MSRWPSLLLLLGTLCLVGCPTEEDGVGSVRPRSSPASRVSADPAASGNDVKGGITGQGQPTPPPAGAVVTPSPSPTPTLRPLEEPGGNATPPAPTPTPSVDPYDGSMPQA